MTLDSMTSRTQRLCSLMVDQGVDVVLASAPVNMGYLTGFFEGSHERLMVQIFRRDGSMEMVLPALSEAQAARTGIKNLHPWADGVDPYEIVVQLIQSWGLKSGVFAVDDFLPSFHLLRLQDELPAALFRPAGPILSNLRAVKEAEELKKLTNAGRVADEVYNELLPKLRLGMTEVQIEALIREAFVAKGTTPTFCIVGIGPGSAEPHHINGNRSLSDGDLLLLDFGCELDHYQSDITRCVAIGHASDKMKTVYDTVYKSHMAGAEAIRPGTTGAQADAAARNIIEAAGYGEFFIHRLGHGMGIEGHELPNLVNNNHAPLEVGNCFSIEPGIYLPDEFGIRIENCGYCSETGYVSFNQPAPAEIPVISAS